MMIAGELAALLARQAETVAAKLLPQGRRQGVDWICGSVDGEEGKSLRLHLEGEHAGHWRDWATDDQGDLLDLWSIVNQVPITEAITQVKEFLGIKKPRFAGHKHKQYAKPPPIDSESVDDRLFRWLTEVRKISPIAIAAYRISTKDGAIVFPCYRGDELVAVKYRRPPKQIWSSKDTEPALFGWQCLPENTRRVHITEGEIDALSLFTYGFPAISIPFGGGKSQTWIETEYDNLERFDEIFLVLDNDYQGQVAAEEIAERLGRHRCRLVELPRKDANDCLTAGIPRETIEECVKAAYTLDPEELRSAADYTDDIIREFYPPDGSDPGFDPPFSTLRESFRFRRGEVTLLYGINSHGKSALAQQVALHALHQYERTCIASMEFKPKRWLKRITRQAATVGEPNEEYIRAIVRWYSDRLWVFDVIGRAQRKKLFQVFTYARRRYNVRFFVVDNLSTLDINLDDYNGQRDFVQGLCDFAKDHDSHVLLLVHPRKRDDEDRPINKLDVKGSGSLTDLADNVLSIWRNKKKEQEMKEIQLRGGVVSFELLGKPDAILECQKQRETGEEPAIALWFDKASTQFLPWRTARPFLYVNYSVVDADEG